MADDYEYVTPRGVVIPDTADLLAAVQQEFRDAFGQDLIVTPDTPQGLLIVMETLARDAVVRNNAALANQINPNLAGGVFLDAIWALTGGQRVQATRSVINGALLAGVPGAIIPQGARASVGAGGDLFETTGSVTLDATGAGVGTFRSVEFGPVPAAPGALTQIVTAALGWETVTNPAAATLGEATESDEAARERRRRTLSLQNVALPEAIVSGLYDVPDVTSVLFRENVTDVAVVEEGVTINPHSIFVCVDGGLDSDVAASLLANKSLGCGWSGDLTVPVVEPVSGQEYPVTFQRPDPVTVYVSVTVKQVAGAGGTPAQTVREAIQAYAAGDQAGEPGLTIGQDVSPFELAGAINRAAPDLYVSSVLVGTDPMALAATPVTITIAQRAAILNGNITVVVT